MVPLPKAAILLSPWCDLSCSSKSWEDNEGLDFLPAEARVLHGELFADFQHPAYSYCFGENRQRKLEILSPVGSKIINRIPSIMNLSSEKLPNLLSHEARMKDQALISERLDELERDTLERFVRHPLVSPIFAELKGLPPILIVKTFNDSKQENANFYGMKQ